LGRGEPGFQRVAPTHQLVHLRHYPPLIIFHLADFFRGGVAVLSFCAARSNT
jgi:hypothetical protein